jgi:hypothetical protein
VHAANNAFWWICRRTVQLRAAAGGGVVNVGERCYSLREFAFSSSNQRAQAHAAEADWALTAKAASADNAD